jgi:hypothetical protein
MRSATTFTDVHGPKAIRTVKRHGGHAKAQELVKKVVAAVSASAAASATPERGARTRYRRRPVLSIALSKSVSV